jgi:hypothetical protein
MESFYALVGQPIFRLLKNGLGMLTNALSLRRMQEWVGGEKAF